MSALTPPREPLDSFYSHPMWPFSFLLSPLKKANKNVNNWLRKLWLANSSGGNCEAYRRHRGGGSCDGPTPGSCPGGVAGCKGPPVPCDHLPASGPCSGLLELALDLCQCHRGLEVVFSFNPIWITPDMGSLLTECVLKWNVGLWLNSWQY